MDQFARRPTQETACPSCEEMIPFYRFGGMSEMYPHFYCDACSNVYFSRAHHAALVEGRADAAMLQKIGSELPRCPCGGQFRPGANPKCPACRAELPHRLDAEARLLDPFAVLVDGAVVCQVSD